VNGEFCNMVVVPRGNYDRLAELDEAAVRMWLM
jgi:hypothetical protein